MASPSWALTQQQEEFQNLLLKKLFNTELAIIVHDIRNSTADRREKNMPMLFSIFFALQYLNIIRAERGRGGMELVIYRTGMF